ncbi:endopeptidase La [Flavobacteriales bacterium]|nr:endopeptidase La [Flavobacteriales bacterium]|tara:strand:- start:1525 stop:3936 length:2412 start_codon:yes stop_codon:yes gene_type:complete
MNEIYEEDIVRFAQSSDEGEFIPLFTSEDEDQMNKEEFPDELPILPLRNNVLFPGVVIPITVGRDKSIKLIKDAYSGNKILGVVSQTDVKIEDPNSKEIHTIGTVGQILKHLKMPDGSTTVIIQGKRRFETQEITQEDPYIKAKVKTHIETRPDENDPEFFALYSSLKDLALKIIKESPSIPSEASFAIKNIESPTYMINFIASNINADVEVKQQMLEEKDMVKRAKLVLKNLTDELQLLELKNDIQSKVKTDLDKQQRDYYLHQQMRQIQEELGDNPSQQEVEDLRKKAEKKKWSKKVKQTFYKELSKLERMNPQAAEYSVQLNYLQLLTDLPWKKKTKDNFDLKRAQEILDRDHFGLDKVKERIIEHLAVLKLKKNMKAPILCLYGPPGVGKTSLGKSIAEAIGRKYVRMSLGGLRDEAEIRGHRKTYIGAMPGRILQNLKKVKTSNPVFVLDEIDKLTRDSHGDPSSALLEVLDPEQNSTFNDNFVDLDYDLSNVLFVATANSLNTIQPALRDRMEIIEINGYTIEEKVVIARKYLLPKQLKETGVRESQFSITDETLETVVENYTNESGVRGLEKRVSKLVRFRAKQIAMEETFEIEVVKEQLNKILGPSHPKDKYQGNDIPGVVTGLAWTQNGGDILFIETSLSPGKEKLTLTGNLGDVMKESAVIALEYLKSNATKIGIEPEKFTKNNIHIHVPEGATPKDGPSAGITILTALTSIFMNKKVRSNIAMTGEITLRGKVLPVGGIKEKILAAKRAGIKEIILCQSNKKDIDDINPNYLEGLEFHYVDTMFEVLDIALI